MDQQPLRVPQNRGPNCMKSKPWNTPVLQIVVVHQVFSEEIRQEHLPYPWQTVKLYLCGKPGVHGGARRSSNQRGRKLVEQLRRHARPPQHRQRAPSLPALQQVLQHRLVVLCAAPTGQLSAGAARVGDRRPSMLLCLIQSQSGVGLTSPHMGVKITLTSSG